MKLRARVDTTEDEEATILNLLAEAAEEGDV